MSLACAKRYFLFVTFLDTNQVVSTSKIQSSEELCFRKLTDQVRDKGKRVPVLDCHLVKSTVINAKAQGAILLFDKEARSASRGLGVSNKTFRQVFLDVFFHRFRLLNSQIVNLAKWNFSVRLKVDGAVVWSMIRQQVSISLTKDVWKSSTNLDAFDASFG
jgi:hypothetical protein